MNDGLCLLPKRFLKAEMKIDTQVVLNPLIGARHVLFNGLQMTPSIDLPDTLIYRYDMTVEEAAELARRFIYEMVKVDAAA